MDRGRGYKVAGAKAIRITYFVVKRTGTRKAQPVCQYILSFKCQSISYSLHPLVLMLIQATQDNQMKNILRDKLLLNHRNNRERFLRCIS
jgi:hypothetical protein